LDGLAREMPPIFGTSRGVEGFKSAGSDTIWRSISFDRIAQSTLSWSWSASGERLRTRGNSWGWGERSGPGRVEQFGMGGLDRRALYCRWASKSVRSPRADRTHAGRPNCLPHSAVATKLLITFRQELADILRGRHVAKYVSRLVEFEAKKEIVGASQSRSGSALQSIPRALCGGAA
jgi:hypothetical protein